jgi:phenylalanyl-tRNA synthetase alpha subunit
MKTTSRRTFLPSCSILFVWMVFFFLSSSYSSSTQFLVRAQDHNEDTTVTCDCSSHIETAKQETTHSFQAMMDDLNQRLQEAVATVTGKDNEIGTLNTQLQEVTSSMSVQVNDLTRQLAQQVQESETAVHHAVQASQASLEQMKATLHSAQEETKHAQQQVSKYINQRFFINFTLLKQDLNSLLKKIGWNKSDEL